MKRDLGEMGEATLRHWAAQVGAVANRASPDRTGWDFLLEIHRIVEEQVPLDKLPYQEQVLIQVKATDQSKSERVSLKLSNWKRLMESELPAFILVLHFEKKERCERAYLIHVWEPEMAAVLKRLRELTGSLAPTELHERRLTARYGPEHALGKANGFALVGRIRTTLDECGNLYAQSKVDLKERLGYEGGGKAVNVRFTMPKEYEARPDDLLVDFSLGLLSHIELTGGDVFDVRFGIPSPYPEHSFPAGTRLEIGEDEGRDCKLRLGGDDRGLELDAKLFVPKGLPEDLLRERLKIRLDLLGCRLVVAPQNSRMQMNLSLPGPEDQYRLGDLESLAKLILLLTDPCENEVGEPLQLEVAIDGLRIGAIRPTELTIPDQIAAWARLALRFCDVAFAAGAEPSLEFYIGEMLRQATVIDLAHQIVEGRPDDMEIGFTAGEKLPEPRLCFPGHVSLLLGETRIMFTFAMFGTVAEELEEERIRCSIERIERVRTAIMVREALPDLSVPEMMREIAEKFDEGHTVVDWWTEGLGT